MKVAVSPSGRDDEWAWQVTRDGVQVGLHMTRERAQAFADRGGDPEPVEVAAADHHHDDRQLDMFGAVA